MRPISPKLTEKKRFSIIARALSFKHAIRGISVIFKTQHNAWVHAVAGAVVLVLGFYFRISEAEWGILILAITSVLSSIE
jgi:diacylglycerol kinase (ATP)